MLDTKLNAYPYVSPIGNYRDNLACATRTFIAALLGKPLHVDDDCSQASARAQSNESNLDELAAYFEAYMPNQAAELRYLADGTS